MRRWGSTAVGVIAVLIAACSSSGADDSAPVTGGATAAVSDLATATGTPDTPGTPSPPPATPPPATDEWPAAGRAIDRARLQEWLDGWRAGAGLSSVVVGLQVGDEEPVVAASGGTADDVIDPSAPFYIASITKTFVAAIVLQLVEEGSVDLDEPASRYVTLWPEADAITVRQLLGHRSGLSGVLNLDALAAWAPRILEAPDRVWSPQEVLAIVADEPLRFVPGSEYHYSNSDFIVAGLVVEAVTGEPLAAELASRLTGPLGLDETSFDDGTGPLDPRIPPAYLLEEGEVVEPLLLARPSLVSLYGASAAMVSSPADLVHWARSLYGTDDVLSAGSRLLMFDPDDIDGALGAQAVCGCSGTNRPPGRGHSGIFPGFDSVLGYFAPDDVAIVVYTNHSPTEVSVLERAMGGILDLVTVD